MSQVTSIGPLQEFTSKVSGYLPTLAAGLIVLGFGVVLGWVAKRAVVRLLIWIRLDRLGGQRGWRSAFNKGDVRAALSNGIGTVVGILVMLLFLDNALQIWGLTVLSRSLDIVLVYLPNLALVVLIVGVGVLLSNTLAERVEEALEEEDFAHSRLVAKAFKATLLSLVGALALWQLGLARQIVMGAFLIGFGSIGVAFALAAGIGSSVAIREVWQQVFTRRREEKKEGE